MRIAHLSDTHIQAANPDAKGRIGDLARVVDSINALAAPPDVVLHSGDIAHDATSEDYAAARAELDRLNAPLYTTIGNRDRRAPYFQWFGAEGYLNPDFGFAQYAVDLGALYLVAVDTQDHNSALGGFCSARANHLRRLLAAAHGKPTLVFAHHPPLTLPDMKAPELQYRDAAEAALLVDCLNACPGLVGVVTGHVHRTRAVPLGEVTLSTVPSIAADLSREKVDDIYLRRPIYHVHTWVNGMLATSAVTLEADQALEQVRF